MSHLKKMKNLTWHKTQNSFVDGREHFLTSFRRMQSEGTFLVPRELLKKWKDRAPHQLICLYLWSSREDREGVSTASSGAKAKTLERDEGRVFIISSLPCDGEKTRAYDSASFFFFFFSEYQRQLHLSQLRVASVMFYFC